MKHLKTFKQYENATCNASSSAGMGSVVSSQPGALPGTFGSSGSGDVGFTLGNYQKSPAGEKKKRRPKKGNPSQVSDLRFLANAKTNKVKESVTNYPTMEEVNSADGDQILRWHRFLPSPENEEQEKVITTIFNKYIELRDKGDINSNTSKRVGYLKTYEAFENLLSISTIENIQTLKEILYDLDDLGYTTNVSPSGVRLHTNGGSKDEPDIFVNIKKNLHNEHNSEYNTNFYIPQSEKSELENTIERVNEYMRLNGWKHDFTGYKPLGFIYYEIRFKKI
jgi:hypothetical protein